MKGKKIVELIGRYFDLFGKKFSQSNTMLFIPATDLNEGKEVVFCDPERTYPALIEDPRQKDTGIDVKYVPNVFPEDTNVLSAMAKSIRVPAAFTVLPKDHNGNRYDFSDGGELDNNASKMLISCIDVGKILMVDLGYSNQSKGLYRNKNLLKVIGQAIDIMQSVQRHSLNDPQCREDVSIRVINPGLFGIGALDCYKDAQEIILSAKGTAQKIIKVLSDYPSPTTDPKVLRGRFFSNWGEYAITGEKGKENNMSVKRYGGAGTNVYYLFDKEPIMNVPGAIEYEKDGGKIIPKEPGLFGRIGFYSSIAYSLIFGGTAKLITGLFRNRKSQIV